MLKGRTQYAVQRSQTEHTILDPMRFCQNNCLGQLDCIDSMIIPTSAKSKSKNTMSLFAGIIPGLSNDHCTHNTYHLMTCRSHGQPEVCSMQSILLCTFTACYQTTSASLIVHKHHNITQCVHLPMNVLVVLSHPCSYKKLSCDPWGSRR